MIYLDNAATTGKKPQSVIAAVVNELSHPANPGRSSHKAATDAMNKIYETRENLATLFHSRHPENFILTPNATYALNFAIKGIVKEKDHVITTHMEHNSVTRPLNSYKDLSVTEIKGNEYGVISPREAEENIRKNTTLIVINHSSNVNGIIQDVKEIAKIARKHKIPILLDASQTAGIIDINAENYDLIAFPGHKGLYGPQGTGGLYISPGILPDTIITGGTGSESKSVLNPDFLPDRFESGTLNCPGFSGLSEGIKFILKTGITNIAKKEQYLVKILLEGLSVIKGVEIHSPLSPENISSAVSFNIRSMDSTEVSEILNSSYDIATRPGFHCAYPAHQRLGTTNSGSVRASVSVFTTLQEIRYFLSAVNRISESKRNHI